MTLEERNKLVEDNLNLVWFFVHKTTPIGMTSDLDMFQAGCVGLIEAAEKFEKGKGFKFSTYATPWIRRRISDVVRNGASSFTIPRRVYESIGAKNEDARSLFLESIKTDSLERREETDFDSCRSIHRNTKEESVEDVAVFIADFKVAYNTLSKNEKQVIMEKIKEKKMADIETRVGMSKSWINKTCKKFYGVLSV